MFGDPEVTGKPAGDDLSEGKRTVLVALTLAAAPADEAALLEARLGRELSEAEVAELRGVIERSGAAAEVETRIDTLTSEALGALETGAFAEPARAALRQLADAATRRVH